MPAVTDCSSLDKDRPIQRTDIEVDDSDQESFHPSFDNQSSELDYWLGKKWFEWFTWQQLMSLDRAKDSIQAMDFLCDTTTRSYPYSAALSSIQGSGYSSVRAMSTLTGRDERELFLISLGSIMSRGSDQDKDRLTRKLQQHRPGESAHRSIRGAQETARSGANSTEGLVDRDNSLMELEQPDPDLPRYTAKLKERSDRMGFVPGYRYEEIGNFPPAFRCVLTIRDYTFEGVGGSMKRAKHEASRDACRVLGVPVR